MKFSEYDDLTCQICTYKHVLALCYTAITDKCNLVYRRIVCGSFKWQLELTQSVSHFEREK